MSDLEVKKHRNAIQISNKISFLQRKLSNALLYHAYDSLLTRKTHVLDLNVLAEWVGFDSKNEEYLKNALRGLVTTPVEWSLLDKEGQAEWGVSGIIAGVTIKNRKVYYSYSDQLTELLYNPDIFARIDVRIQQLFNSEYALALWENCLPYVEVGYTEWYDLDTFRKLMGADGREAYNEFKILNREVIKPAMASINASSNISLEVELEKEKKRVVRLRFKVASNKQGLLALPAASHSYNVELLDRLVNDFCLTEMKAKEILDKYPENYILENLQIVEARVKTDEIENVAGYTLSALSKDYRPKLSRLERDLQERKLKERVLQERKEQAQVKAKQDRQEQARKLDTDVTIYLESLPEQELQDLQEAFTRSISGNAALSAALRKNGFESATIKRSFKVFIGKRLKQTDTAA